jgi:HSP20 family protein
MNLTVKKNGGFPSFIADFLNPSSLLSRRDLFNQESDFGLSRLGINLPTANVSENGKEYKIELAVPGLNREDFTIELENNMLKVSAQKEEESKKDDNEYSMKEYSFNSFCRTFIIPENVKEADIEAKYEKGILKVTIPKEKETPVKPAHKISVR